MYFFLIPILSKFMKGLENRISFFAGVTYSNECQLKVEACKGNLSELKVASKGMCEEIQGELY